MPDNLFTKLSDQYSNRIYQITLGTSLFILLALLTYRILLLFTYNGEIGGIDNNFVYAVIRGMAGFSIYPDPSAIPYAINPYSPLYINLCVFTGNTLQLNTEDPITIYRLCRTVSLICDITTILLFFRIIQKTTCLKKEFTFLATSIFACLLCYLGYTFSRADSLFLLVYALIFYVLLTGSIKKNILSIIILAFLTTACIFSKQNGIILPLLISVWLLINDTKKNLLLYIGLSILFFAGSFFLYKGISGNHFFTSHTIDALRNKIDLSWFYVYLFKRFSDSLILLPIYIAVIISFIQIRKGVGSAKALSWIFIIQTAFSLGTSLKFGASAGYFNESFFLGLLLINHYYSTLSSTFKNQYSGKLLSWFLPLFVLFTVHVCAQGYLFFLQNQKEKKEIYQNQLSIGNYLKPKLENNYILNLGNQNGDFFKTIFFKEAVVPNYDAVSCCTLPDKIFDYSSLVNDLQNGKIKYLLMNEQDMLTDLWGISLQNFKSDTLINGHVILKFMKP